MSDPLSPDPDLERRVVAALRERGLLRRRSGLGRVLAALAAAATFAAIGFGAGSWRARASAPGATGPLFVLLLTDEAGAGTAPASAMGARVEEYRSWAIRLRQQGRLVGAEKLKDAAEVLGPAAADGTRISGYFVIRAASRQEALDLARSHPHLRYGGAIALREIDPV